MDLENLALSVKRLQLLNYRTLDVALAPLGLSLVQWRALRVIEQHPGFCMHQLAELTFNSDQALGTLMSRLLRQKLVERHPGAGRTHLHLLTPRGKTLLAEGLRIGERVLARNFAALDDAECRRLQTLLGKVLGEELHVAAAPKPKRPAAARATTKSIGSTPAPRRPRVRAASSRKPTPRRVSQAR